MGFCLEKERKETVNKTIRFPLPLVDEIEKYLFGTEATFSKFVIQACRYVIEENKKKLNKEDT